MFLFQSPIIYPVEFIHRINFKKYEKTNLPNYDHLMNSSAYKMIHKMEREPQKGIPVRPAKVIAAEDILERVVSALLILFFISFFP